MSITELWVSANEGGPSIPDVDGHEKEYSGDEDVRSCLTCQHQLDDLVENLRNTLKQQDDLAAIESEVNRNSIERKLELVTMEIHQINDEDSRRVLLKQVTNARLRYPKAKIRKFLHKQLRTTGDFDLNTLPTEFMTEIEAVMLILQQTSKLVPIVRKKGLRPRQRFKK
ncbi:hypothetical protein [Shewanella sp. BJSY2023SW005]|uniref:hypothetical protein n=1 Tax=Shewanella sp. BJSY2023SW005 TaxID=3392043 RepID=UPI0039B5EE58